MSVGKTLELLIRQRGLSYSEIGRAIGRSSQMVGYDVDKDDMNTSVLRQYTEYFGISIADFFMLAEGPADVGVIDDFLRELEELNERTTLVKKQLQKERARIRAGRYRTASLKPATELA